MSDVKKSERVEKALRELGSAFIDATVHAQDAFALVAYVKSLEGKVAELATDLESTRNERNAAHVQARREISKEYRDRIANLEAQTAPVAPAVDAQPGWISVDERLPEIDYSNPAYARGVKVLAAWGNDPGNIAEMEYRSNAYAKTEKGRLPRFEWQGRVSPWTVTHWMPLPEAPTALSQHKAGEKE